jgi:hypothetical protein
LYAKRRISATPTATPTRFRTIQNVSGQAQDFASPIPVSFTSVTDRRQVSGKENRMIADSMPAPLEKHKAWEKHNAILAIAAGGLIAGTLDLLQACILFGWKIPLVIAAGLLGRQAIHGGAATYILGVLLHFFIATSAAAIYYAVSRKLTFMTEHPLVCGLFFGAAVEEVMNLVVLPLSALHARGPYQLHDLILGLLVHMVVIGLPISYSIRRFAN